MIPLNFFLNILLKYRSFVSEKKKVKQKKTRGNDLKVVIEIIYN